MSLCNPAAEIRQERFVLMRRGEVPMKEGRAEEGGMAV